MGNSASFEQIVRKHGKDGVDYVVAKYHERQIYERINDQIKRLKDNADLQQQQDIQFINQQRLSLNKAFEDAKNEAETKKKGSIQQSQARSKQKVEFFSGYNDQVKKLEKLQKQVRDKYESQRVKMQQRVREQVKKSQGNVSDKNIPEYDNHPDNYRKNIEQQCIRQYPNRAKSADTTDLQRKLTWENYKQNFVTILSRDQVRSDVESGAKSIRNSIVPGGAPICC